MLIRVISLWYESCFFLRICSHRRYLSKLTTFLTSPFFAGVTGSFYTHYIMILAPDSVFSMGEVVEIVAITLVGGIGTFLGPTLGAFALIMGLELLRGLKDYRLMIHGAMLVPVILLMPHGLLAGICQIIFKFKTVMGDGATSDI